MSEVESPYIPPAGQPEAVPVEPQPQTSNEPLPPQTSQYPQPFPPQLAKSQLFQDNPNGPALAPPAPQKRKHHRVLLVLLILIAIIILAGGGYLLWNHFQNTKTTTANGKKPNIVFVLTDDESLNLMQFMPNTNKLIGDDGAKFSNYFDNISLCCAARASIMLGEYAHNTKVEDNAWPTGGFQKFNEQGHLQSNIATWMHDAGYDTSLMGKYLNEYPEDKKNRGDQYSVADTYVPPGWTDWFVPTSNAGYREFNYTMNDNGKIVKYGKAPTDYLVDVMSKRADNYITAHKDSSKPYFMYLATFAPHAPYTPATRYKDTESKLTYPKTPAFNETDNSDKPAFMGKMAPVSQKQQDLITKDYQLRAEAVRGVDDMVSNLYNTLKSTGQLDNTYIVFTSDNGYHMGEHRLGIGKNTAYETDTHLPLYIRGPGIKPGTAVSTLSGNIDLAPTFAALGGVKIPSTASIDGQSLVPYLQNSNPAGRAYYLIERHPSDYLGVPASDIGKSNEEPEDPGNGNRKQVAALAFQAVRSDTGYVYVAYQSKQYEFYDLNSDPYELNNLLPPGKAVSMTATQTAELAKLKAALVKLQDCKGSSCIVQ